MRFFVFVVSFFLVLVSFAQEVQPFKNKQLINAQTTVIPSGFEFNIQHRFGQIALDRSIYEDFFGFDGPANVRFSLAYKLNDRLYFGVGRTSVGKTVDLEGKYLLVNGLEKSDFPLSIALYSSVGIKTQPFVVNNNMYFSDSLTSFEYSFAHKLDYCTQLIFSKSITEKVAINLSPTIIHKNLVSGGENNVSFALPVSGKYQYSFGSSLLFEYAYCLGRDGGAFEHPLSLGFEFGTAGHVFQVFISNSQSLRESNLYTTNVYDISSSEFLLGFNIRRVWWF